MTKELEITMPNGETIKRIVNKVNDSCYAIKMESGSWAMVMSLFQKELFNQIDEKFNS